MKARSLTLVLALIALLLGCSRGDAPKEGSSPAGVTAVKLALNWVPEPEFGGFYAAKEGAYKANGLEVDIIGGGAGSPVVPQVATGKVDFGVAGADEVLMARARGADVIPIFATYQTSPQGLMAHASRGAKSIADLLKDGSLAIEPGQPYAAFIKKKHGFDKVKIVPYDGGVARFVLDKDYAQQCYVTSEPIAAKRKGSDPQVFLVADDGFNPYVGVVITRAQLWKEKPALVKAFVKSIREGWSRYLADPKATNAVMAKLNAAMDAETFAAAAEAQKPLIEGKEANKKLGAMTVERWTELGKQLTELGIIDKAQIPDLAASE